MKVRREGDDITVELTRRNLQSLLAKLDGNPPNSACTIFGQGVYVKAVENEEHYGRRPPGPMHEATEQKL